MTEDISNAKNLLTDAIESSAISYWAEAQNVVRDDEGNVTQFDVRDDGDGDPDNRYKDEWTTITVQSVLDIVPNLLEGQFNIHRSICQQFAGKVEYWDYDAEGIDCVIQIIAFGELVFG